MHYQPGRTTLCGLLALLLAGCIHPPTVGKGKSPLQEATMSSDSVAVEIYFVRLPEKDTRTANDLWREIDEQQVPAELRQRLAHNGFRVGVVGGTVPRELARLMELKETLPAADGAQHANAAQMEEEKPRVTLRHLQARASHRSEIVASEIYEHLPVLVSDGGELRGQTYSDAQGIFALRPLPQSDGLVQVELVPELHFDHARQRWVGDDSMWRLETSRPRRAFEDMTITTVLRPGGMLVMGALPNRSGSLGHYFFTERDNPRAQKLLLLRLCQTQHDDLVAPPPLKLE
jgi:hypothetical protein